MSDQSTFLELRSLLFPDTGLQEWVLDSSCKDKELRKARECIRYGKLEEARQSLDSMQDRLAATPFYWWVRAYLESEEDNLEASRGALERILALPERESRTELLAWKHLRGLNAMPSDDWKQRVLGVVCEMISEDGVYLTVLAGYSDGQLRRICDPGPSLIGEIWSESEMQVARSLVEVGQTCIGEFRLSDERNLPKPGTGQYYLLTPGGVYRALTPLDAPSDPAHPLHQLCRVAGRLNQMCFWLVAALVKQLSPQDLEDALADAVDRADAKRVEFYLQCGARPTEHILAVAARRHLTEISGLLASG